MFAVSLDLNTHGLPASDPLTVHGIGAWAPGTHPRSSAEAHSPAAGAAGPAYGVIARQSPPRLPGSGRPPLLVIAPQSPGYFETRWKPRALATAR